MKHVDLVEITTKDGMIHQGMYVAPPRKSKTAILYVHGLTSAFYHGLSLQNALIEACTKHGYGYASFNNRGHDYITSTYVVDANSKKGKRHVTIGGGVEDFTKCLFDIDAGISFLEKQGYTSIILFGHSTGANKVCYYGGKKEDARVGGIILASPISDRLNPTVSNTFFKRYLLKILIALGFGNTLFTQLNFFPITPKRALSLLEPYSDEDVFDYGEDYPQLELLRSIKKPLLVLFGSQDEYSDRPIETIQNVFDTTMSSGVYTSVIIPDAVHGFDGKEGAVVKHVIDWMKTTIL